MIPWLTVSREQLAVSGCGCPVVEPPTRALWAIKRDGEMKKQGVSRSATSEWDDYVSEGKTSANGRSDVWADRRVKPCYENGLFLSEDSTKVRRAKKEAENRQYNQKNLIIRFQTNKRKRCAGSINNLRTFTYNLSVCFSLNCSALRLSRCFWGEEHFCPFRWVWDPHCPSLFRIRDHHI